MGVPAFFRWLSEKYPKIVEDVVEERVQLIHDGGTTRVPFDCSRAPNPSGLECDNLYIDMNGIIHPCSHPENGPQPSCEEEMFENVVRYVDRLMRVIRPRQLLYLAIDGVAPRAKMNQQRSRRFRSAQEVRESLELESHVRDELVKQGLEAPDVKKPWDSNVITPGTPFMIKLAEYIRFYIRKRMSTDPGWKDLRVIFSDASVPGEGEHKIMAHIRLQRTQPGYNPNIKHVLHGLDADLIMLALATHEQYFYISRELVMFGRKSREALEMRQMESGYTQQQQLFDEAVGSAAMQLPENTHKPLVRISIPTLREYIANEFAVVLNPKRPMNFKPDLERLIDDIVFLCFFVGNDFLPHLPSLDIRDGALDFLFNVYKRILPNLRGYITNHGGNVDLSSVDIILAEVGSIEDYVFAMKHENEQQQQKRREEQAAIKKANQARGLKKDEPPLVVKHQETKVLGKAAKILQRKNKSKNKNNANEDAEQQVALKRGHQAKEDQRHQLKAKHRLKEDNKKAANELRSTLLDQTETSPSKKRKKDQGDDGDDGKKAEAKNDADDNNNGDGDSDSDSDDEDLFKVSDDDDDNVETKVGVVGDIKEEFEDDAQDNDDDVAPDRKKIEAEKLFKLKLKEKKDKQLDDYKNNIEDKVRLHEPGWKDRYYKDKCKADNIKEYGGRDHLFRSYIMGLCWVMKYYYDGCVSWKWYYPFHYAPFASDLKNIERFQRDCKQGFELGKPFSPIEQLMSVLPSDSSHAIPTASRWLMCDSESPIIDFYPTEVPVDPNGKAMPWLWVVLLPFIDEERLLDALKPSMKKWSKTELLCNARGLDDGYIYVHRNHAFGKSLSKVFKDGKATAKSPPVHITDSTSCGINGIFGTVRPPLSNEMYDPSEDIKLEPPSSAKKISGDDYGDSLFLDPIECNDAICLAFSEPLKISHKSMMLPGSRPPRPVLTADDKKIRRPRLNFGGASIAMMGGSRGGRNDSHKSGYGSMNISSYERGLAERTGRGNQMYQAGTRQWGAMEPTPKRHKHHHQQRQGGSRQYDNPFKSNQHQNRRNNPPPPPPPPQQYQQGYSHQNQQAPPYRQYSQQATSQNYNHGYQQQRQGYQNQRQQHYQQQQNSYQQTGGYQQQGYQQQNNTYRQSNQRQPPPPGPQQGYNFRNFNQQGGNQQSNRQQPSQQQNNQQSSSRGNVMNSLRAQLVSTLKQNRGARGGNDRRH